MLTIDLLKGQGLPIKSRPEGIAIVGITVVVPLAIMAIMITSYLGNRIVISAHAQEAARYKTRADKWSDEIELHKSFEREKNRYTGCFSSHFRRRGSRDVGQLQAGRLLDIRDQEGIWHGSRPPHPAQASPSGRPGRAEGISGRKTSLKI